MSNILDYIKWRGDLSFQNSSLNEIDNLILARLSYFYFDGIFTFYEETISLKEAYERFKKGSIEEKRILQKEDLDLFPAMANSKRFSEIKLTRFINKVDEEQEKQFSAITLILPDNTIFVSYRGTDNTIIGWREDLNMSFKKNVPAQLEGVKYLEEIGNAYPNKIRISGHSKGGNVAIYSAAFASKKIKERIIEVYNNDGPGVDDEVAITAEYKDIIPKTHTYVPQTSIIGRLLSHEEKYTVIESTQKGIMQHDLYTWQLIGKEFIHLDEVDSGSVIIDKTIKKWLKEVSPEQRGEVINTLFDVLGQTEATTLSEIKLNWFKNAKILYKSYQNVSPENKEIVSKMIDALFKIMKNNIFESIPRKRIIPERFKRKGNFKSLDTSSKINL